MRFPHPRGPLSERLLGELACPPHPLPSMPALAGDPLHDDDLHLSLAVCYELHNGGVDGVDESWEWEPSLLGFRAALERRFEDGLRAIVPRRRGSDDIGEGLRTLLAADRSPSLSSYLATNGTPEQFAEFVVHRSFYQLREADPHTWAIPRLRGAAKAAMVMVQVDEYGGGREERMHSSLFAQTMRAFELDVREGAYIDHLPGVTLATTNLMFLFGLHRQWRAATVGHLAMFEMTSTGPNKRYGDGLRRLGFGPDATEFFDEHVTADAVHERIAADVLAVAVAEGDPSLASDVLFGAECLLAVEARWAGWMLDRWGSGRTSLRKPLLASLPAA